MPTVLSDPPMALYAILAAATLVLGIMALRRQKKADLTNFAIAAIALIAVVVIDQTVDSPREQVVKIIKEMETATQEKKLDDLFKHVSDKFQYKSLDKKALRDKAAQAESIPNWQGIKVSKDSLNRDGFATKGDTAEQKFEVMPLGLPGNEYRYQCTATFKNEGGQWRLVGFTLHKDGQEVSPPGL